MTAPKTKFSTSRVAQTRLCYLDTKYFRNFVERTDDPTLQTWQRDARDIMKTFLPCKFLRTPVLFLEIIGIGTPARSRQTFKFEKSFARFDGPALGKAVLAELSVLMEDTIAHYKKLPELSPKELRERASEFVVTRVTKEPMAQFVAKDIVSAHCKDDGFEQYIYQALAFDEIQYLVRTGPKNELMGVAQLQLLKEMLGTYAAGTPKPACLQPPQLIIRVFLQTAA